MTRGTYLSAGIVGILISLSGCGDADVSPFLSTATTVDASDLGDATRRQDYRTKSALIIGVNEYNGGLKRLRYAVNDAKAISELLISDFGYETNNIRLLLDGEASRQGILAALDGWLPTLALKKGDSILVFFAGHGERRLIAGCDAEIDRPNAWISIDEVRQALEQLECDHRLVILDSCFSGALLSRARVSTDKHEESRARHDDIGMPTRSADGPLIGSGADSFSYYLTHPAYVGLTAAREQPAVDGFGNEEHSVFTLALLKTMKQRAYSRRTDRAFTFRQLAPLVEEEVAGRLGDLQIPDWGCIEDGDGDFVFVPQHRDKIKVRFRLADDIQLDWFTSDRTYKANPAQDSEVVELETTGRYYFRMRSTDGSTVGYGELTLGGEELEFFKDYLRAEELWATVRAKELTELRAGKSVEMVAIVMSTTHLKKDLIWQSSAGLKVYTSLVDDAVRDGEVVATLRLGIGDPTSGKVRNGETLYPGDSDLLIARFRGALLTKEQEAYRDVEHLFLAVSEWSSRAYAGSLSGHPEVAVDYLRGAANEIRFQLAPAHHRQAIQLLRFNERFIHRFRGGPDYQSLLTLLEILEKHLKEPYFVGEPLGGVLAYLSDNSHLEFDADWRALERMGVTSDQPIDMDTGELYPNVETILKELWKREHLSYRFDGKSRITLIPAGALSSPEGVVPIKYYIKDLLEEDVPLVVEIGR